MEPLQATTKELFLSFNAGNSNKIQHIAFWYVKHKNRIKLSIKKLNIFLADIQKMLLRHPSTLCF